MYSLFDESFTYSCSSRGVATKFRPGGGDGFRWVKTIYPQIMISPFCSDFAHFIFEIPKNLKKSTYWDFFLKKIVISGGGHPPEFWTGGTRTQHSPPPGDDDHVQLYSTNDQNNITSDILYWSSLAYCLLEGYTPPSAAVVSVKSLLRRCPPVRRVITGSCCDLAAGNSPVWNRSRAGVLRCDGEWWMAVMCIYWEMAIRRFFLRIFLEFS